MSAERENQIRRQAAWATFEPHLEQEQRIEALWMLEKGYQKGDMNTLINYVAKVGERYGLSDEMCKKLYYEYFRRIREGDSESLPEDPLPLMRQVRQEPVARRNHQQQLGAAANSAQPQQARQPVQHASAVLQRRRETPKARQQAQGIEITPARPRFARVAEAGSPRKSEQSAPKKREEKPSARKSGVDPKQVIFSFLMSRLVEYYGGDQDQLFIKLVEKRGEVDLPVEAAGQFTGWITDPANHHWRSAMSNESMSALLQLLLVAIADLAGREEAERLLKRVVAESNQLVEAQSFSADTLL